VTYLSDASAVGGSPAAEVIEGLVTNGEVGKSYFEREWYGRDRSTPEALREAEDMARGLLGSLREAA